MPNKKKKSNGPLKSILKIFGINDKMQNRAGGGGTTAGGKKKRWLISGVRPWAAENYYTY